LKRSDQRDAILDVFLRSERHLSVDDLLHMVQKKRPDVGRTTVYRTLKLLQDAGLAQELVVQGQTYFEREYNREHHDHFICNSCGEIIEFSNPDIERLQDEVAAGLGFVIEGHRHQIYGQCRRCVQREPRVEARK
jgi:Fur family ferric uptake transcriptional regulator